MKESQKKSSQRGANLVEYVLLTSFIAVFAILAVRALGTSVSTRYSEIASVVIQ